VPLTISINKNFWYSSPIFPLLSLLCALTFSKTIYNLLNGIKSPFTQKIILCVTLSLISFYPFRSIFIKSNELRKDVGLAELLKSGKVPQGTKIISSGYNSPLDFYQKAFLLKGIKTSVCKSSIIHKGDFVLITSEQELETVKKSFPTVALYTLKETELLLIK
jgi:hypothetical protein